MPADHDDDSDLFGTFSAIEPASKATEHAIAQTRSRLLEAEQPTLTHSRRWTIMMRSIAGLATAAAVVGALLIVNSGGSSIAFADVKDQVRKTRTAAYKYHWERDGVEVTIDSEMKVRDDGRSRSDRSDGRYYIFNVAQSASLEVDPRNKTAYVRYFFPDKKLDDPITMLRRMHEQEGATALAAREVDGLKCPGFKIPEEHGDLRVWVNPKTRLPVLAIRTVARKMPPPHMLKDHRGGIIVSQKDMVDGRTTETYSDFRFDVPLDDALFDVKTPDGFIVKTHGTPPGQRHDRDGDEKLVLTLGTGLGPLKFGMSRDQIVQHLGQPEEFEVKHFDKSLLSQVPEGKELVIQGDLQWEELKYNSRGLVLEVRPSAGLARITCESRSLRGNAVLDFRGQTKEGIRMGSTQQEVLSAYGEPRHPGRLRVEPNGNGYLHYPDLHLQIAFRGGKVAQIQNSIPDGQVTVGLK